MKKMVDKTPHKKFRTEPDTDIKCPQCGLVILKCTSPNSSIVQAARENHKCKTGGKRGFEEELR